MIRLAVWICALTAVVSCIWAVSAEKTKSPIETEPEAITIFLTGNELGALKPCGCSGGQLGGFDRRGAILNSVVPSKRLIIDTGGLVEGAGTQDLIKFNIAIQALGLLGYDVVNLHKKDIQIAENQGLLEDVKSVFNVITAYSPKDVNLPGKFTKKFSLKGRPVIVTVATFDAESAPAEQIGKLLISRCEPGTVNILILGRCTAAVVDSVCQMGIFDCLICPADSDEPGIIKESNNNTCPLVVSVGRYGKYVGRLQITASDANDGLNFSFDTLPVVEQLPQEDSLVELYKVYQQIVEEANLIEDMPRFNLAAGVEYMGSESCRTCHEYEYDKWSTKAHARAYETLKRLDSDFDPECVVCHVIGMEYEGGFVSEQKTPHFKNVGCESCHGPGSAHIKSCGKIDCGEPKLDCTDCHTPEKSTNYADNELHYFEKIIHWREPNLRCNVE